MVNRLVLSQRDLSNFQIQSNGYVVNTHLLHHLLLIPLILIGLRHFDYFQLLHPGLTA